MGVTYDETRGPSEPRTRWRVLDSSVGGEFGAARGNHKKEKLMSRLRRPPVIFIFSLFVLALLAVALGDVFAQSGSIRVPDNARATGYGSGWECDRGYRQVKRACAAVKAPANAYLNNSAWLKTMEKILAVSRSGFYVWCKQSLAPASCAAMTD